MVESWWVLPHCDGGTLTVQRCGFLVGWEANSSVATPFADRTTESCYSIPSVLADCTLVPLPGRQFPYPFTHYCYDICWFSQAMLQLAEFSYSARHLWTQSWWFLTSSISLPKRFHEATLNLGSENIYHFELENLPGGENLKISQGPGVSRNSPAYSWIPGLEIHRFEFELG